MGSMLRFALKIEYDGAPFSGWQRQTDLSTVQGEIETALSALEPNAPLITGAGRTDAGVHAFGQVAHVDVTKDWQAHHLSEALNYHLKPHPIVVVAAAQVNDAWHARFDARERQYRFRLISRRARMALEPGKVWHIRHALNLSAMRQAADHLIGKHDFTTFRSSICQSKSPVKTLDEVTIVAHEIPYGTEYVFTFRARSFLHNQVRSFVGSLERVGAGAWVPEDMKAALQACDRAACGPVCPPDGLYLEVVSYPQDPFATIQSYAPDL